MPLTDIFKRKKAKKPVAKEAPKKKEPLPREEAVKSQKRREKIVGFGSGLLSSPHITEKASDLLKVNQYTFKVSPEANKTEVKKAIENLYGVDVLEVRIINIPRKAKRMGRQIGWSKGYKKAIIKIKEGQKIEVLPR